MEKRTHIIQLCLAGLLCSAFPLFGQLLLSTIRGSVTDASGADVVGAKVMITDVKTNVVVRTVTSDAAGNFEAPDLVTGVYRVTAEAAGFKTFVADNIVLEGSQIRRISVHLEVGQLAERVTVQAGVSPITTDSAQITSGIQRKLYDDSPMVRNYYPHSVMSILPGVESQGSGWNLNINGQGPAQVAMGMDGVTNDGTVNLVNRLDFSEITVTGVNNTADQARAANYNMISKRGDNNIHGEVYFTFFNSALNARNFFDPVKTPYKEDRGQIARMVKNIMRRGSNGSGDRRAAAGAELSIRALPAACLLKGTGGRCLCPDDCVPHGSAPETPSALDAASPPQTRSVLRGIPA